MPYEAARATFEIALHLDAADPQRASELARAREAFVNMRAARDVRKVDAVAAK